MRNLSFLRNSWHAKTVSKYCHIFLTIDLILICVVVYFWFSICHHSFCTSLPRKSRTNILAFGDSMTRGYVSRNRYYPYSKSLEKTLNRLHSRKVVFAVDNGGLNGDTAIGNSKTRLRVTLNKKKYDWVIILFGTNDLRRLLFKSHGKGITDMSVADVNEIFASLKQLCELALQEQRMIILGTITARQCEDNTFSIPACESLTKNRLLLNDKIRSFVANSKEMILLADFDKQLDYMSMSKEKREQYWQDDVHLTETGYEFMAKLIYRKMRPYLPALLSQPDSWRNVTLKQ